jgi:hypothetical protein
MLSRHREELALKQRKVRKCAYIHKHGIHAYIQRRFDAPIPGREPDSDPEPAEDAEDDLSWGDVDPSYSARICDYSDPCLKRI